MEKVVRLPKTVASEADGEAYSYDLHFPEWQGVNALGRSTRKVILQSALSILVEDGYKELTMRQVALRCGVKFGNLTYHYPTWNDLINDLIGAVIGYYEKELDSLEFGKKKNPVENLEVYIKMMYENLHHKTQTRLLPELWTLSNRNECAAQRVAELYVRGVQLLTGIIEQIRPDLERTQCEALATFMSSSFEGMLIFAGLGKPYQNWAPTFGRLSVAFYTEFVQTVPASLIGTLPEHGAGYPRPVELVVSEANAAPVTAPAKRRVRGAAKEAGQAQG
jgi:AcrR family transcriptional regulator